MTETMETNRIGVLRLDKRCDVEKKSRLKSFFQMGHAPGFYD
jgi:hypothetical protein